jgi:murein DD-endopeptidase MepM/ murein hydrolase activator NlpD
MKKLFYFSKSRLQFVEIKNFKSKLTIFFSSVLFLILATAAGGYFVISTVLNSGNSANHLRNENLILKGKLDDVVHLYGKLNNELDSLVKVNGDLRIAVNLPSISSDERKVGVGGGYFDNNSDFLVKNFDPKLKEAFTFIDEISRKFAFEKSNYKEISDKIAENRQLFESIPAIKPCQGTVDENSFGMRMHPVLKILRMHEGIDIVTDIGTPIYATGKGSVEFVGNKGGYGLCLEVNHGFGYTTLYGHLSSIEVQVGQKITRGTLIARTGNSGLSSGPHLHYEVSHNGVKLNPVDFFFDDLNIFAINHKN